MSLDKGIMDSIALLFAFWMVIFSRAALGVGVILLLLLLLCVW
jgi:hypothetical protein